MTRRPANYSPDSNFQRTESDPNGSPAFGSPARNESQKGSMETALAEWNAMTSDTVVAGANSAIELLDPPHAIHPPHQLEQDVRRQLLQNENLKFSTLVVRRLRNGVCLEGVVEMAENAPDLVNLVMSIDGIDKVDNRLVVRRALPRRK